MCVCVANESDGECVNESRFVQTVFAFVVILQLFFRAKFVDIFLSFLFDTLRFFRFKKNYY